MCVCVCVCVYTCGEWGIYSVICVLIYSFQSLTLTVSTSYRKAMEFRACRTKRIKTKLICNITGQRAMQSTNLLAHMGKFLIQ